MIVACGCFRERQNPRKNKLPVRSRSCPVCDVATYVRSQPQTGEIIGGLLQYSTFRHCWSNHVALLVQNERYYCFLVAVCALALLNLAKQVSADGPADQ